MVSVGQLRSLRSMKFMASVGAGRNRLAVAHNHPPRPSWHYLKNGISNALSPAQVQAVCSAGVTAVHVVHVTAKRYTARPDHTMLYHKLQLITCHIHCHTLIVAFQMTEFDKCGIEAASWIQH